ncbi:MAG: mechanosensitive ion channel [Spirochaetales bacterium]|nr:mechanosensitive ion channel [Spirochaetales bacterium]
MSEFLNNWLDYIIFAAMFIGSFIIGFLLQGIIVLIIKFIAKNTTTAIDNIIIKHIKGPLKLFFPIAIFYLIVPLAKINEQIISVLQQVFGVLFIVCFAWILIKAISIFEDVIKDKYRVDVKDNLNARKIHTQMQVLKKIVAVIVCIVALAVILMRFEEIRQLGTTLLASAGIIGLIIGFAAQKTLGTLFAGFQLAFTQPIRIDDVVIVENEWGKIEEITLTYVVVRIWDQRRLVVPISYFIERPFQNWTRVTAELLGTVFIYCDYTIPLEALRKKLKEICEASPLWDKRVCLLQVTDAKEQTLELRALVSAADSGSAWDLRCKVREELVGFIQRKYEKNLPRVRACLDKPA